MRRPYHKTSKALDIWSGILFAAGVIAVFISILAQDWSIATLGVMCILGRPLFRALSVLTRSAERSLFEHGDGMFTVGKDEPQDENTPQS